MLTQRPLRHPGAAGRVRGGRRRPARRAGVRGGRGRRRRCASPSACSASASASTPPGRPAPGAAHDGGDMTERPRRPQSSSGLDTVRAWQEDFYRDLHAHPELPHQEHRTAANVAARLRDAGCEVHEGVGGTGVVGILRNGDGPTVLLRADMDALPVREETGLPYASTADVRRTAPPVMHACGHDVHVTCLLGAVDADGAGARAVVRHAGRGVPARRGDRRRRPGDARRRPGVVWSATSTWRWPSTCCRCPRASSAPGPGRRCRPPTACGSPCTGAAPTGPCRRPPSTRSCWRP